MDDSKINRIMNTIKDSVVKMVRMDAIPTEQYEKMISIYPSFIGNTPYVAGDIIRYSEEIYEVIQSHTSQDDWKPSTTASLFKKVVPEGVIPQWVQPVGGHDAYKKGFKVIYNNQSWESTVDGNVWQPSVYGWVLV